MRRVASGLRPIRARSRPPEIRLAPGFPGKMSYWAVVRSLPRREAFAAERLRMDHGFEVFLPLVRTKRASAPLFAGYFFCRIVEQWRSINSTFGVLCLVRVGDCPARCPDREIAALKAMIDGHSYIKLPEAPPRQPAARSRSGRRCESRAALWRDVRALRWPANARARAGIAQYARRATPSVDRRRPDRASMTLATPDLQPPRRAPIGVIDPVAVARREAALVEALRARPGAALGALAEAAGHTRSATADRLRRLAARGAVVRVAGRWRLAGEEPEEPDEAAMPKPEPEDLSRWVRPIGLYLRAVTSEFACARYG